MASHNAKIQFDYVEKWLKCETRYFEKFFGTEFLVKKIPWKRHSLGKNFLEIEFLVKKFLGMTFLGKRFPCYVVSPKILKIRDVSQILIFYRWAKNIHETK